MGATGIMAAGMGIEGLSNLFGAQSQSSTNAANLDYVKQHNAQVQGYVQQYLQPQQSPYSSSIMQFLAGGRPPGQPGSPAGHAPPPGGAGPSFSNPYAPVNQPPITGGPGAYQAPPQGVQFGGAPSGIQNAPVTGSPGGYQAPPAGLAYTGAPAPQATPQAAAGTPQPNWAPFTPGGATGNFAGWDPQNLAMQQASEQANPALAAENQALYAWAQDPAYKGQVNNAGQATSFSMSDAPAYVQQAMQSFNPAFYAQNYGSTTPDLSSATVNNPSAGTHAQVTPSTPTDASLFSQINASGPMADSNVPGAPAGKGNGPNTDPTIPQPPDAGQQGQPGDMSGASGGGGGAAQTLPVPNAPLGQSIGQLPGIYNYQSQNPFTYQASAYGQSPTGTQGFNSGQDPLMQSMQNTPGTQQYNNSDLFAALKAQSDMNLNTQVGQLQGSAGSLGARFGTALSGNEALLRSQAATNINATNQQIGSASFEAAQQRQAQAQLSNQNAYNQMGQFNAAAGQTMSSQNAQQGNIYNQLMLGGLGQAAGLQQGQQGSNASLLGILAGLSVPQQQTSPYPGAVGQIGQLASLYPFLNSLAQSNSSGK